MPILRFTRHLGFVALVLSMVGFVPTLVKAAPAPVVALFTDYAWDDPYVAQIKGTIVSLDPNSRIIDLTHSNAPFSVAEAAYLLDQSAEEFPAGTIFVAAIDSQFGAEHDPVLVETGKGKFYIGPDSGLFTQVVDHEGFSRAWKLDKPDYFRPDAGPRLFQGRDIFAPIAAHLATGTDPDRLGTPIKTLVLLPVKDPTFSNGTIAVEVLHIDRYGNIILNLTSDGEMAPKLKEGNLVKISIGRESYSGPLVKTYGDVEKGRLLLVYGDSGLLEISMNQGSAFRELKVDPGTVIFLKP